MSDPRRSRRDEGGAVALVFIALSVVLLMMAALSVDIGVQINKKQQLQATLDSAAQAGASQLPSSTATARTTALRFAAAHDATATGTQAPAVDFWCVVASTGSGPGYTVDTTQLPTTCYPGGPPYTVGAAYGTTGRTTTCSAKLCAIPCETPTPNTRTPVVSCNTIRVHQGRDVPFSFAPAGGFDTGSTGSLVSVACQGSCGTVAPNPLDVVVVADRTPSMEPADLTRMIAGIRSMLTTTTPSQQYVALGTIGRSVMTSTRTSGGSCRNNSSDGLSYPSGSGTSGQWVPIGFTDDYADDGTLNSSSTLVKGVSCLSNVSSAQGTALAAPFKAAARYLLGGSYTANNLASLPARTGTPRKVLIFETDGQPNESPTTTGSTALSLASTTEPYSNGDDATTTTTTSGSGSNRVTTYTHTNTTGGNTACNNLLNIAAQAKAQGILVITVGYNMVYASNEDGLQGWAKRCTDYDGFDGDRGTIKLSNWTTTSSDGKTRHRWTKASSTSLVSTVLAAAASPVPGGGASTAQNTCSTATERAAENADGDYFFCAASGEDLAPVFTTALSQASSGIKLMNLP